MQPTVRAFLFGVFGSVAVEVVRILAVYESGGRFAERYRKAGFWAARVALALIGGMLAVAYDVRSDILAIHIGASAPIILKAFGKDAPKSP